jgi:hypothetical protein
MMPAGGRKNVVTFGHGAILVFAPRFGNLGEIAIQPARDLGELGGISHRLNRIAGTQIVTNAFRVPLNSINFFGDCAVHFSP